VRLLSIITVIPAKAGIFEPVIQKIPACAGMTMIFILRPLPLRGEKIHYVPKTDYSAFMEKQTDGMKNTKKHEVGLFTKSLHFCHPERSEGSPFRKDRFFGLRPQNDIAG
jgi:hypothetical protein